MLLSYFFSPQKIQQEQKNGENQQYEYKPACPNAGPTLPK